MEAITWFAEKRKIIDLKLYPGNPRKIDDEKLERLKQRIEKRGFHDVLKVDTDNFILSGNQRHRALQDLGIEEVEVMVPSRSLTKEEREQVLLESNIQEGDWDEDILKDFEDNLLADIGLEDFVIEDNKEIVEDEVPDPPKEAKTKPGDLYILGEHRLLCGDSTKDSDVAILMDGAKADMVFTDPPYNVDYEGYTRDALKIKSDAMSKEDYLIFLSGFFSLCVSVVKKGASFYICHASSWQRETENCMNEAGIEMRCQIIWAKNTFAWGFGRYKFRHEPIFYAHLKGQSDSWYGDKSQSTLWEVDKPSKNKEHPTMKPVELIGKAIKNSSKGDDIVLDLFGGSGSTLIACEQLNRKCYMMEIDPIYCDVIIKRWENLTGRRAELCQEKDK